MPFWLMPLLNYWRDETLNGCLKGQRPGPLCQGSRRSGPAGRCWGVSPVLYPPLRFQDLRLMTEGWGLTPLVCLGDTCGHPARVCAGGHCLSTQIRTEFGHTVLWTCWRDVDVAREGSVCACQWSFVHTCVGVTVRIKEYVSECSHPRM